MSLVRSNPKDGYIIRGWRLGVLSIADQQFTNNLIVTKDQLITDWPPVDIQSLKRQDLSILLTLSPDIVLIGTGEHLVFPSAEVYSDLIKAGIGVEIMHTAAACRTYNALASEHRHVAAALLLK